MENLNINELLLQLQAAEDAGKLSSEQRAAELAQIEKTVKQMSKLMQQLFDRKEELEQAEADYQLEQEALDQRYMDLSNLYSKK